MYHGKTVGKNILKLRVVTDKNQSVKWYHCLVRYGILYFIILPSPIIIFSLLRRLSEYNIILQMLIFIVIGLLVVLYISCILKVFLPTFKGDRLLFYEKLSHSKNMSTIERPENNQNDIQTRTTLEVDNRDDL